MQESQRGPSVLGSLLESSVLAMGHGVMQLQQQQQQLQYWKQRQEQQQQWQQQEQQQRQQVVTVPAAGSLPASPPGLLNRYGFNNCFLNALLQCLWHCRDFRDCLLALPAAVVIGTALLPRQVSVQASFV